jgi:hypothetical protein
MSINEYVNPENIRMLIAQHLSLDELYESGPGHF